MVTLTKAATDKILDLKNKLEREKNINVTALRISIKGGGCSGFNYSMAFLDKRDKPLPLDKAFKTTSTDGRELEVRIDPTSMLYLDGCEIDYVETLEGAGFKFNNPNVKSTCGCGSSFSTKTK